MATEILIKYGVKGEIKIEHFMEIMPEQEVLEVMTFRFCK
jgi:hypothetical protein